MTYGFKSLLLLVLAPMVLMQGIHRTYGPVAVLNACTLRAFVQHFSEAEGQASMLLSIDCTVPATRSDVLVPLPFAIQSRAQIFQEPGAVSVQYFYGAIAGHPGFSGIVLPARGKGYHLAISVAGISVTLSSTAIAPSGQAIFLAFGQARKYANETAPSMLVLGWDKLIVDSSYVDHLEPAALTNGTHSFILNLGISDENSLGLTVYLTNGGLSRAELILLALVTALVAGLAEITVPVPKKKMLIPAIIGMSAAVIACAILWFKFYSEDHLSDIVYLLPIASASGGVLGYLSRLVYIRQGQRQTRRTTQGNAQRESGKASRRQATRNIGSRGPADTAPLEGSVSGDEAQGKTLNPQVPVTNTRRRRGRRH